MIVETGKLGTAAMGDDRRHRYSLTRSFTTGSGDFVMVGLNPSTADADRNDHTIVRGCHYAKREECRRFLMLNLFAFRSTDPSMLHATWIDPIGPEWEESFAATLANTRNPRVVVAWGFHGEAFPAQVKRAVKLLQPFWARLECFGACRNGEPKHPARLPNTAKLELWPIPRKYLE